MKKIGKRPVGDLHTRNAFSVDTSNALEGRCQNEKKASACSSYPLSAAVWEA